MLEQLKSMKARSNSVKPAPPINKTRVFICDYGGERPY